MGGPGPPGSAVGWHRLKGISANASAVRYISDSRKWKRRLGKVGGQLKVRQAYVQELMASSPQEKYRIHSYHTNNNLLVRPPAVKRTVSPVVFQIAYDERLLTSRAALLESHGFTVISTCGNEAARAVLEKAGQHYDLFVLGHSATPKDRREMAAWLKAKYPTVQILALNPPYQEELKPADYNLVLNSPDEWLFLVEASTA